MGDRDDSALEYEEGDMYEQFRSFYEDVFPEFVSVGKVVQFKVWTPPVCVCVCVNY
jgi:hypothetical protein